MLPLLLVPAAIGVAGLGAKKGYDGYKTKKRGGQNRKRG